MPTVSLAIYESPKDFPAPLKRPVLSCHCHTWFTWTLLTPRETMKAWNSITVSLNQPWSTTRYMKIPNKIEVVKYGRQTEVTAKDPHLLALTLVCNSFSLSVGGTCDLLPVKRIWKKWRNVSSVIMLHYIWFCLAKTHSRDSLLQTGFEEIKWPC